MTEFKPSERQSICDLLVPPDGYRFESAIGTSYSLDFVALTACCAALLDQEVDRDKDEEISAAALKVFLKIRGTIGLFVNQAGLKPDSRRNPLFAVFDDLVHPVQVRGHAFHPKIWAVKYVPSRSGSRIRQPIYRLVCGSRNVTTAQTWEACVAVDGALNRRSPGESGPALRRFLTAVLSQASGQPFARPLRKLTEELGSVRFTGLGERPITFHAQWPRGPRLRELCSGSTTTLLISPFVGRGFLQKIAKRSQSSIVVSLQSQLDLACESDLQLRGWLEKHAYVVDSEPGGDDQRLELHAKIRVVEDGTRRRLLLGSANGTGAAWGDVGSEDHVNWEAIVALEGTRLSNALMKNFIGGGNALQPWIRHYKHQDPTPELKKEVLLEEAARALGDLKLVSTYQQSILRLSARGKSPLPAGVEARIAPYLLSTQAKDFEQLFGRGLAFSSFPAGKLSRLFIVRFRAGTDAKWRERIVIAECRFPSKWQEDRNAALIKPQDLQHAALSLLDIDVSGRTGSDGPPSGDGDRIRRSRQGVAPGLLESLLRAWTLDPHSFERIGDAITARHQNSRAIRKISDLFAVIRNAG